MIAASIAAFVLCWFGKISGDAWVYAQVLILGTHQGTDVLSHWSKP